MQFKALRPWHPTSLANDFVCVTGVYGAAQGRVVWDAGLDLLMTPTAPLEVSVSEVVRVRPVIHYHAAGDADHLQYEKPRQACLKH